MSKRKHKAKRARRWLRKQLAAERKVGVSVAAGAVHRGPLRERYLDTEATEALANLGDRINDRLGRSRLQSNWREDTPADHVRPGIAEPEYVRVSEVRLMDGAIVLKRDQGPEYKREEGAYRGGNVRRMRNLARDAYVERDLPRDPIGPIIPFKGFDWAETACKAIIPPATRTEGPHGCVRIKCPGGDPLPIRKV